MIKKDFLDNGIIIYQDDDYYTFTSDSILLSEFATVKSRDNVADFCSGSGVVGLNLYSKNPTVQSLTLFEMQPELFLLSEKSIKDNNLGDKVKAVNCKLQDLDDKYRDAFSLIVCNPPYMQKGCGEACADEKKAKCKSEQELSLDELFCAVNKALRFGGRVAICHRADRLCEVIAVMQKYKIEPKRLQTVSGAKKAPYLILIEGVKGGKSGIKIYKEREN